VIGLNLKTESAHPNVESEKMENEAVISADLSTTLIEEKLAIV
jgi:hypothetical protein